jgi:hypothetical protein
VFTGATGIVIGGLSGRNTMKAFNVFFTWKKHVMGNSHIIRKILQLEA